MSCELQASACEDCEQPYCPDDIAQRKEEYENIVSELSTAQRKLIQFQEEHPIIVSWFKLKKNSLPL